MDRIGPLVIALTVVLAVLAAVLLLGGDADPTDLSGDATPADSPAAPATPSASAAEPGGDRPSTREQAGRRVARPAAGARIEGRLVDDATGSPVADADVRLKAAGDRIDLAVRSGEDGGFTLRHVPPADDAELWVTAESFAPAPSRVLQLRDGDRIDLGTIRLTRGRALTGWVLSSIGRPLPGANVYLVPHRAIVSLLELDMFEVFDRIFGRESAVTGVRTDERGAFRFAHVADGEYVAAAHKEGYQARYSQVVGVTAAVPPPELVVHLDDGRRLQGVVVDEAGNPVPGARVALLAEAGRRDLMLKTLKSVTGDDGAFAFESLGEGPHIVFVRAPGFAPHATKDVSAGATDLRLVIQRGVRLTGRVFDQTSGRGLSGVRVAVMGVDEPVFASATSGRGGAYEIAAAPPVEGCMLIARLDGFAAVVPAKLSRRSFMQGIPLEDRLVSAKEIRVDVPMVEGGEVSGRVVDARTREPIAGADVHYLWATARTSNASGVAPRARTGSDGRFRLRGVPPGPVAVRVFKDDFPLAIRPGRNPVLSAGGRVPDLAVAVLPPLRLCGQVVDLSGRPVPAARINFGYQRPHDWDRRRSRKGERLYRYPLDRTARLTGDDGCFELAGVPRRCEILVTVRHADFPAGGTLSLTTESDDVSGLRVVVHRGAIVHGRLVDPAGRGIAGVTVRIDDGLDGPPLARWRRIRRAAVSGGDGRFEIEGLLPGRARASVHAESWRLDRSASAFSLDEDEDESVVFELTPAADTGSGER